MPLRLLQAPEGDVLPLEEAKAQLRVDFDEDDALIESYVRAAVEHYDGADGILNRALLSQKWALDLPRFPGRSQGWLSERRDHDAMVLQLPLAPVISIDAVKYNDCAGVLQTLDPSLYIARIGEPGSIEPMPGVCWPVTDRRSLPVSVEFTAGYAVVPQGIKAAIKLLLADLYENREGQVIDASRVTAVLNATGDRFVDRLIFKPA